MIRLFAILVLLLPIPAFATFGAATAWDVRTTGANTNGGAFDSGVGSPGTNESLGAGTAITCTLTGTTTGTCVPAISSTTHGPGNFVHIASGSGCTTGWFEINSQSAGTATFDHAMGSSTNVCVGVIGGSLLTIAQANTNSVDKNTIWLQSGTFTLTTTQIFTLANLTLNGYASTHGDGGTAPLITTATNSTDLLETNTGGTGIQQFINLALSNTAGTPGRGIFSGTHGTTETWLFKNTTWTAFTRAIDNSDTTNSDIFFVYILNSQFVNNTTHSYVAGTAGGNPTSYITGSTFTATSATGLISNAGVFIYVGDSTFSCTTSCASIISNAGPTAVYQRISINGTSAAVTSTAALNIASGTSTAIVQNSIFYGALDGILINAGLSTGPGGVGINNSFACNAFGNNTNNILNGTTSASDVILSALPFTSTTNFALNSTAGGGAALKGVGCTGAFPGGVTTGHPDIGAVQSAGSSGATGNYGLSN